MKILSRQEFAKIGSRQLDFHKASLAEALEKGALFAAFQTVADLESGGIAGHLGSVLGPLESPHRRFDLLLSQAAQAGELARLAKRYFEAALTRYAQFPSGAQLFLPVPATMSENLGDEAALLLDRALDKSGLEPGRLVIVHPGISNPEELACRRSVQFAIETDRLGVALASATLPCGMSESLIWSRLAPVLVFLDEGQMLGLNPARQPLQALRRRIQDETTLGRRLVAQGINTLAELETAQQLGVHLVCGEFLGRIASQPSGMLAAAAHKAIRERARKRQDADPDLSQHMLGRLLLRSPMVTPDTRAEAVSRLFADHQDLRAVAVVADGIPIGLISRHEMMDHMARPYRQELFGRKACTRFMDDEALTLDVRLDLPNLTDCVVNASPRQLVSGFIVTDTGRYLGTGSLQDLVREITAMQMEAARHSNPLTQLPGNVPINQHIDAVLAARIHCAIAYCDLDNFKPFNDVYGYAAGDQLITATARILSECCDPELDFVGHVGGDDFVVIFRSEDWEVRCGHILERFASQVRTYFPEQVAVAGGYEAENRKGEREFIPLTALSIGVVEVAPDCFDSYLVVATVAAEAKKKAKAIKGNSMYINQRSYACNQDGSD